MTTIDDVCHRPSGGDSCAKRLSLCIHVFVVDPRATARCSREKGLRSYVCEECRHNFRRHLFLKRQDPFLEGTWESAELKNCSRTTMTVVPCWKLMKDFVYLVCGNSIFYFFHTRVTFLFLFCGNSWNSCVYRYLEFWPREFRYLYKSRGGLLRHTTFMVKVHFSTQIYVRH